MKRAVLILAALIASSIGGCVRIRYDLCAVDPPHEDCFLLDGAMRDGGDAATDAALDAGAGDGG